MRNELGQKSKQFTRLVLYFLYRVLLRYFPNDFRPYAFFLPSLRNYVVKLIILEAGKGIRVKFNADISPNIKVGDFSELGERCLIYGGTEIGREVLMGQDVKIFTQNHNFNDLDKPIRLQGVTFEKVVIGDDVWVCSNVVILPGVKIGSHSVIASGSVVTKSFPPYSLIGGNPARLIKKRIQS